MFPEDPVRVEGLLGLIALALPADLGRLRQNEAVVDARRPALRVRRKLYPGRLTCINTWSLYRATL